MNESTLDKATTWYFGNNRKKNLKLSPPKWYAPFFMTTSYEYAEKYSDYGVYALTLKNEVGSKILDFSKDSDIKKLKWPKELIDDIRTGKSDLNGIAYDMYILAGYGNSHEVFDKSWYLSDAAYDFDVRSENIFDIVPKRATWTSEKDHRFLLQMWKDIYDAGFDGFTHIEFGKKILALFDFKCIEKISINPVMLESYEPPYTLAQIKSQYPKEVYNKLSGCPVHSWRAETGIELIHKEPTEEELDRIWKNWQLMPQEMKDISDKKSIELFGCTNAEHYSKLKASKDHLNENKAAYLQKYRCLAQKVAK